MRLAAILVLLGALVALGATFAPHDEPRFDRGTATISTRTRQVVLNVELARTPAELAGGLMRRRSLGRDSGMVFLHPTDVRGAYWMKDTQIPLAAAFADAHGKIVRILRMAPCRTRRCPLYDPGVGYRTVLEVNAGAFDRWGVGPGARLVVRPAR